MMQVSISSWQRVGLCFVAVMAAVAWPAMTFAVDGIWTNGAGGAYSTPGNWQGGQIASGVGATANFNTLDIAGDLSVTLDSDLTLGHLIFGDTGLGSAASWELRSNSSPVPVLTLDAGGGTPSITVNQLTPTAFDDAFIAHRVNGTAGLAKNGAGILTLGGQNSTLAGPISVNGGTLRFATGFTNTGTTAYNLANGAAIQSFAVPLTTVNVASGATATLTASSSTMTITDVTAPGTGETLNLNIALNNVTVTGGGNWTGFEQVNMTGQSGSGISFFRMVPNNSFTGAPPATNMASFANTKLHLDNIQTTVRTNSQGNTVVIGELTGTSSGALGGGNTGSAARYQIGGLNTSSTFSGQINGAGGISINKVGSGTLTLAGGFTPGANGSLAIEQTPARQGGVIRVTGGTLALTGAASIPGGPAANPTILTTIDVLAGAVFDVSGTPGTFTTSAQQKIQGNGTVRGPYNHAAGFIRPGDLAAATAANEDNLSAGVVPTAGTLTFDGNLQFNGGAIIYDMATSPGAGNDLIQVTGTTNLSGGGVLTPNFLAGNPAPGQTYTVLNSSLGFSGAPAGWTVNWPGRGPRPTLFTTGNMLQFTTTAIVGGAEIVWTGSTNGNWNINTTQNWTNGGSPDVYFDGDSVTFNDSATTKTVNIAQVVAPASVTINNNTPYTFTSGGGVIVGTTGLTKTGSGMLTMQVANTFSGPANISGSVDIGGFGNGLGTGQLTLNNATLISSVSLANSQVVVADGTNNTIQAGGAAGAGNFLNIANLSGGGTLTLTSAVDDKAFGMGVTNNFTGTLNVQPTAPATLLNAVRARGGQTTFPNAVVNLTSARFSNQQGAATGSTVTFEFGELNGNVDSQLNSFEGGSVDRPNANWQIGALGTDSEFAGTIVDGAAPSISMLTKVGGGTLRLTGENTYSGNTVIQDGTLSITNPSLSLADAADVLLSGDAIFDLDFNGTDTIRSLFFNGASQVEGTWGSMESAADHKSDFFTGLGILNVTLFVEPTVVPGDYNNDGRVDGGDYVRWRNHLGEPNEANINNAGDGGDIGISDYAYWKARYGNPGSGGGGLNSAVPEPATATLLLVLLSIGAGCWRRR